MRTHGFSPMVERLIELALSEDFEETERVRRDAFWEGVVLYRSGKFEEAIARFSEAQNPGESAGSVAPVWAVTRTSAAMARGAA